MLLCAPLNGFDRHCGSCHSRQHIVHKCMLRCACVCVCVLYNRYVGACVMSSVTKPDKIYCRKNAKTRKTQASVANALRRSPSSGWHPLPLLLSITSCRDCIAETTTTKKTENLLCTDDKTFCVCVRGIKKAGQQLQETIETESLGGSEVLKVEALKCRNTHTHNHTHTHIANTHSYTHTQVDTISSTTCRKATRGIRPATPAGKSNSNNYNTYIYNNNNSNTYNNNYNHSNSSWT